MINFWRSRGKRRNKEPYLGSRLVRLIAGNLVYVFSFVAENRRGQNHRLIHIQDIVSKARLLTFHPGFSLIGPTLQAVAERA